MRKPGFGYHSIDWDVTGSGFCSVRFVLISYLFSRLFIFHLCIGCDLLFPHSLFCVSGEVL